MKTRRRLAGCIAIAGLLFVASCSGDSPVSNGSTIDLSSVSVGDAVDFPVQGRLVVPTGSNSPQWVDIPDDQLCVVTLGDASDSTERTCVRWTASLDFESFSWSPDGSKLFFTEDFRQFFDEPDIWSFDVATGALANETDDGSDELFDERSLIDTAPFASDTSLLHFFTLGRDPERTELSLIDENGDVRPLPGVSVLGAQPTAAIYRVGNNRFVYTGFDGSEQLRLIVLDLAAGAKEIVIPSNDEPVVLASGPGAAIVSDRTDILRLNEPRVDFVDIDTDNVATIDLGDVEPAWLPAFAVAPNGSGFVAAMRPLGADTVQLVGIQRSSSGELGEPVVLAPPGFLGTDDAGDPRFPRADRSFPRIIWTPDNRLLIPTHDAIITFELTAVDE